MPLLVVADPTNLVDSKSVYLLGHIQQIQFNLISQVQPNHHRCRHEEKLSLENLLIFYRPNTGKQNAFCFHPPRGEQKACCCCCCFVHWYLFNLVIENLESIAIYRFCCATLPTKPTPPMNHKSCHVQIKSRNQEIFLFFVNLRGKFSKTSATDVS